MSQVWHDFKAKNPRALGPPKTGLTAATPAKTSFHGPSTKYEAQSYNVFQSGSHSSTPKRKGSSVTASHECRPTQRSWHLVGHAESLAVVRWHVRANRLNLLLRCRTLFTEKAVGKLVQLINGVAGVDTKLLCGGLKSALTDESGKESGMQQACWDLIEKILEARADADDHSMVGKITEHLEEKFASAQKIKIVDVESAVKYAPPPRRLTDSWPARGLPPRECTAHRASLQWAFPSYWYDTLLAF